MEETKPIIYREDERGIIVKCHNCSYIWESLGSLMRVTCPSCLNKTSRVEYKRTKVNQ